MRYIAGIGIAMLGLAGCQGLPSIVRIEIDDATLDYKKAPPAPDTPAPEANAAGIDDPQP